MHTFDVYRLYCCLLCLWFLVLLAMNWFADGTKSKQSVILLCVRSDLHLTEFATLGMYTSLKASAAAGKLWSSCCLLLLRDVSLVTATVASRHRTNDASSSRQLPRRTSIRYFLGLFFLLLASWLVLICSHCCLLFGWNLFLISCADACPGEAWICLSLVWVHNLEPKRRAALRFPSFWVQNFALFQPNDNFPSSIFLILNRFSPPKGEMFCLFTNASFGCEWTSVFAASK